jgi:hypothetical protein
MGSRCRRCGELQGHSLRSGLLTSAAEGGASIWKLSEVPRHRRLDRLRGYVRRAHLFRDRAGQRNLHTAESDVWSARLIVAGSAGANRTTECVSFCWRA